MDMGVLFFSVDIERRIAEHQRTVEKGMYRLVASFAVEKEGGKDLLRIAEKYVFDALKEEVGRANLSNVVSPINEKRGRLRDIFKKYPACK